MVTDKDIAEEFENLLEIMESMPPTKEIRLYCFTKEMKEELDKLFSCDNIQINDKFDD